MRPVIRAIAAEQQRAQSARAVLQAFDEAAKSDKKPVDCYLAAVAAWQRCYPDHHREYAAKQVVEVILQARVLNNKA